MGMSRGYNKVAMTDTRRFAGKDIQVGGLERCVWTLLWKGVQDKRGVRSSQEGVNNNDLDMMMFSFRLCYIIHR